MCRPRVNQLLSADENHTSLSFLRRLEIDIVNLAAHRTIPPAVARFSSSSSGTSIYDGDDLVALLRGQLFKHLRLHRGSRKPVEHVAVRGSLAWRFALRPTESSDHRGPVVPEAMHGPDFLGQWRLALP